MTVMMKTVEFFFDFGSPNAYLAYTQLPKIAQDAGAQLVLRPMLLGGVFKATGNQTPVNVIPKGKWMWGDIDLWAKRYRVPLVKNPWFPVNTLPLMRGAAGLQERDPGRFHSYVDVVFHNMWVEPVNLGDPAVVGEVLKGHGFDPAAFIEMIGDQVVKQKLIDNTEEAVKRGVFGAPTMFVGEAMFFGQDRLDFVKEALGK
jgi:2-hydroxychromene-2-carboxylate isomerase